MQPEQSESSAQQKSGPQSGQTNGTSSTSFKYTPFGTLPTSTATLNPPSGEQKRASIDESWVNVDWTELARKSQTDSPAKSPEHKAPVSFGWGESKPTSYFETPKTVPSAMPASGIESSSHSWSKPAEQRATEIPKETTKSSTESPFKMGEFSKPAEPKTFSTPSKPAGETMAESPQKTMEFKATPQKPQESIPAHKPFESAPVHKPSESTPKATAEPSHKPTPMSSIPAKPKSPERQVATPAKETTPSVPATISHQATPTASKEATAASPSKTTPKARTPRQSKTTTPVTPRSSGRQRKTVDRLSPVTAERGDMKAIEVPSGNGAKFGDIAHISKELGKRKSDYPPLVMLHRLVFGRPGEASKRKGHLRSFNGLGSSDEIQKIAEKLGHHTVEELRDLCVMLNLERSGEKKALADRIATFLYKPMDLGESKPSPKRTPQKRKASPKGKKAKVAKTASGEDEETASDEEEAMLEDLKSQEGSAMEE